MSNPDDRNTTGDRLNENENENDNVNANENTDSTGTSTPQNNDVPRSNVTVRIQYQYFTPEGITEINNNDMNAGGNNNPGNVDPITITNAGISPAVGTAPGTSVLPNNNAAEAPDLILSFQDVPLTSPERLNSFITIAAELAMRRFQELMNRPKGITREAFEGLPIIRIQDLPEKENSTCSICYEKFEDEPAKLDDSSKKRSRESSFCVNGDKEDNASVNKVQRTGSETPSSYVSALSANTTADDERTTIPSILNPAEERNNDMEQPTTRPENDAGNSSNEREHTETPAYLHSPAELPCHHIFGRSCLYQWTRLENTCPLCRKKIIENNENERQQNNEGSSNMEAFETIRRLLYNSTGANQEGVTEPTGASENQINIAPGSVAPEPSTSQTSTSVHPLGSPTDGNSAVPTEISQGGAANSSIPNNATVSRTSIIFLRPMMPQQGPNNSTSTAGQFPAGASQTANIVSTPMRIQWLPISLINPVTNLPDQGPPEQNHRLRSIFDNIFSASGSANTVDAPPNTENNGEENQQVNQDTPRNSFFSAMSRIAGRLRSSYNGTTNGGTTNNNDSQSSSDNTTGNLRDTIARVLEERRQRTDAQMGTPRDDIFSAGVGSYRNSDGQVSTFSINHGDPLHSTPGSNQNTDVATAEEPDSTRSRTDDSSNGNNQNEEQ